LSIDLCKPENTWFLISLAACLIIIFFGIDKEMKKFIYSVLVFFAALPLIAWAGAGKVYVESASEGADLKFEANQSDIDWKAIYSFLDKKTKCEHRILVLPSKGSFRIQTQSNCEAAHSIFEYLVGADKELVSVTEFPVSCSQKEINKERPLYFTVGPAGVSKAFRAWCDGE
jgi:energy-coupling factor transporter transmembrane protein EcfT